MESFNESEQIEENKIADIHYTIDFAMLMGGEQDHVIDSDIDKGIEYPDLKQASIESTGAGATNYKDEDIPDVLLDVLQPVKKFPMKDLVNEDQINNQQYNRNIGCITCDEFDHKMEQLEKICVKVEDKPLEINHGTKDSKENYEFAICSVVDNTLSKKAELILRSDSEYIGLQQDLKNHSNIEQDAVVRVVPSISIDEEESSVDSEVSCLSEPEIYETANNSDSECKSTGSVPVSLTEVKYTQKSVEKNAAVNNEIQVVPKLNPKKIQEPDNNTKQLSLKSWKKQAVRLPAGKRHGHTVFHEDILAAYDIIDRTEMKEIEKISPRVSMFSLTSLKSKMQKIWSKGPSSPASTLFSTHQGNVLHATVVKFSVQKTADGEPMQMITLSPTHGIREKSSFSIDQNDGSTIIYKDNIASDHNDDDDFIDGEFNDDDDIQSDAESVDSCLSDFSDIVDTVDSLRGHKSKSYSIPHDLNEMNLNTGDDGVSINNGFYNNCEEERVKEDDDSVGALPGIGSNRFKGPSRLSKSFGGVDTEKPDMKSRRITINNGIDADILKSVIPVVPGHTSLKIKTLPNEPFYCITDGYPLVLPSYPSDRKSLIAFEIYTTERTFVRGLEIVVKLFKARIELGGYLDPKEIQIVFSNVAQILEFNKNILEEIFERISTWSDEQCIGDVFLKHKNEFKMYAEYCKSYDSGEGLMKQKLKKNKNLENLLNSCYANPICFSGLTLQSYLITIIQRIPRYILLLRDLLKRTAADHLDYQNLADAASAMEKVASFINDQLKEAQCEKALKALQTQITGLKALYIPGRNLVHEGSVCFLTSKKTYQCVLFNDLLVFAVKAPNKQSEVELKLDLKTVWFEDLKTLDPQTTKNDAIGIYTPDRPYTMYVGSSNEKKIWLEQLRKAIVKHLYANLENKDDKDIDLETRDEVSYTYKDGSLYSGTYVNSKRHGEGVMMWPNQKTYRGRWIDDERNGEGVLEFVSTGEVYEGTWIDHKQSGLGTYKYANGDTLSGQWKNGLRHGEIFVNYQNGDKFAGDWLQDCINGEGQLICKNGFHYEGEWMKNLMHGKGQLKRPDGSLYNGYFMRGKYHGRGELTYADGSVYKGEFELGERCGLGTYRVPGGCFFDGQWMHDMKDGRGKMLYVNGDEYEGVWVQDMRTGQGIMFYSYGGVYRGQWMSDVRHGTGILENKDGSSYDGEWVNDKMCGSGTYKYSDGEMFKGNFKDNMPNGKGILTKPGGWYCDGFWEQGKQNRKCYLKDPFNRYSYDGDWNHGLRNGMGVETSRDSVYEGPFIDDLRHGKGKETLAGVITYIGYWQHGQKHGKGTRKLLNGLIEEEYWLDGCLVHSPVQLTPRELPVLQRW